MKENDEVNVCYCCNSDVDTKKIYISGSITKNIVCVDFCKMCLNTDLSYSISGFYRIKEIANKHGVLGEITYSVDMDLIMGLLKKRNPVINDVVNPKREDAFPVIFSSRYKKMNLSEFNLSKELIGHEHSNSIRNSC